MVDEVLAPDVARGNEMRQGIDGHFPYHAALMVAWQDGKGCMGWLVFVSVKGRHMDEKERQCLQKLILGQNLTIKELDRIFTRRLRLIGQSAVMPAEVLGPARIGCSHHVAGVGGKVEERILENFVGVVSCDELRHGIMHILILLVLHLEQYDRQAVEVENEINFLMVRSKIEVWAEAYAVLVELVGAALWLERGLG